MTTPTDGQEAELAFKFGIDVLPGRSSVVADADVDSDDPRVRFQAIDARGHRSAWSGWFPLTGEPIQLVWAAFDFATGADTEPT